MNKADLPIIGGDELELEHTERGFGIFKFRDLYLHAASLQQSSLATSEAVWLGCDTATCPNWPHCQHGRCDIPHHHVGPMDDGQISVAGRMHLDRKQAAVLGRMLLRFAKEGDAFWEAADA